MRNRSQIEDDFARNVGEIAISELKGEMIAQGHLARGRLHNSVRFIRNISADVTAVGLDWLGYGYYVNEGLKPGKFIPMAPLINWIKVKGFVKGGDKEIKRAAFAINYSRFKNGIPAATTLRFSKTGRRTGMVQDAQTRIVRQAEKLTNQFVEDLFISAIKSN